MTVPSIGDILMLSQLAWKIGRAFTAGRKGAPPEFLEVEAEINGLAKALKLLAETLFAESDDSLLEKAAKETQDGVGTILNSCQRTVNDLDSLMDQYQIIKKHRTVGGFAIERSWSDLVLTQYKTMMWTTEGGNIQCLRNMLQMHTSTITLTMQALLSKSLSRLEAIVSPMAEQIEGIHHRTGSLSDQLDHVHQIVKDIAGCTPQIQASHDFDSRPPSSLYLDTTRRNSPLHDKFQAQDVFPPRQSSKMRSPQSPPPPQFPSAPQSPERPTSSGLTKAASPSSPRARNTSPAQKRISEFSFGGSTARYSGSYASSDDGTGSTWPSPATTRNSYLGRQSSFKKPSRLPKTPEMREPGSRPDSQVLSPLPPPAMDMPSDHGIEKAMSISRLSLHPPTQPEIVKLHRSATTASQQAMFEKQAFRNAAILCDVRGILVEYTQQVNPDDSPHEVEMVEACQECRICVVRKREPNAHGKDIRVMTSIWVFSDDNTVRLELKLEDGEMYVPYSSYFSPEKVSVTVPCELKYHNVRFGERMDKITKTSWINYVFESTHAAALFQNELMGRTLLGTFRTEKTMRIHEGLSGAFTYAEQMCGMENLRIWEDNDTAAVIALIHFSAHFRNGYLAFYLNSSTNPIKVKDEGGKEIKVKGLRVPLEKGMAAMRKDSAVGDVVKVEGKGGKVELDKKKIISGAKIEFATELEKKEFMSLVKGVQRTMMELPDLLGVN